MTIFPIFFALIENDLKKVLCYSINNQVGFMTIGIGFGTAASINGAVGYAFCNIIFESLLFMAIGAAAFRTGSSKATDLGGLYRTMPATMVFCLIGALSISAFPGFAGFVTKGLIVDAAGIAGAFLIWLVMLFASAGVLEHAGIKIPYFTFFAHDGGKRPKEAPPEMLAAMGISAAHCIAIGVYPEPLYALMPYPDAVADYRPYAPYHVVEQLQLLLWAVLAFALLILFKWYPPEVPATNLDADWFYRMPGRDFARWAAAATRAIWSSARRAATFRFAAAIRRVYAMHGPEGALARSWPTGFMALATAIVLGVALVVAFTS
jgi:multicomponent Na+:H+ antiporter subunit D